MGKMNLKLIEKLVNIKLDNKNNPSEILFITGAGISAADPCSFPIGNELHEIILKYYSSDSEIESVLLKNTLEQTISDIVNNEKFSPKLIHILDSIFAYRPNNSEKVINDYHRYFKSHILNGGTHFTVNIDQFIELDGSGLDVRSVSDLENVCNFDYFDSIGYLLKLHGDTITDVKGKQGYLYEVIRNGFSEAVISFLDDKINKAKCVIFVGYGGVDKCDVTRYFNTRESQFKNTCAIWIEYTDADICTIEDNPSQDKKIILNAFRNNVYIKAQPEQVLNLLFDSNIPKLINTKREHGFKKEYQLSFEINRENK